MELLLVIVGALAVWRVSSIIVQEDGPFYLFSKIRSKAGIVALDKLSLDDLHTFFQDNPDAKIYANDTLAIYQSNFWNDLLSCIGCVSVYVSAFFSLLLWLFSIINFPFFIILVFAYSAMAIFIEMIRNKLLSVG